LKDPILKKTNEVLAHFQSTCLKCQGVLINQNRQMYVLPVKQVNPEDGEVILEAPGGRSRPMNPDDHWQATLRMDGSVAKMNVKAIELSEGEITMRMQPEVMVLQPRSTVRFPTASRSPVFVNFTGPEFSMEGQLTDFCLGGAGITLDSDPGVQEGDYVSKVKFYLRGVRFFMVTARVAHVEMRQKKWYLGLAFDEIPESTLRDIEEIVRTFKERKLDYMVSIEG
jgi:hypothetical protein